MGALESKKNDVVKRYELKVDLKMGLKVQLLALTNWSFKELKNVYDAYTRKSQCPFIDFFIFHKIMPFSINQCRIIFDSYTEGNKYMNVLELICLMTLTSHNNYRKKLQFLFVIFDFQHHQKIQNRELILMFQCFVYAICRATNQRLPKYQYLNKYAFERFIRVNTLQALQKIVNYRRLIEEVEGNDDTFDLFKTFEQEEYQYFKQESTVFMVSQFKKYTRQDVEKMYRIIFKVNNDNNYQEIELIDKNRRFRLENRRISCIKQLMEEKQEKFHVLNSNLTSRYSLNKLEALPPLNINNRGNSTARINTNKIILYPNNPQNQPKSNLLNSKFNKTNGKKCKMLFLNGKTLSKADIFETIIYFKTLSNNQSQIKLKQFFKTFEKKAFIRKQLSSLFKYFDKQLKGEINFLQFLKAFYPGIKHSDIEVIDQWFDDYKNIHEADSFNTEQILKRKIKKNSVQLPRQTLKRVDEIFNAIDRGAKGFISFQDMKQAYKTGFTIKEIEQIMKQFGKSNKIYKDGFILMILPEEWTIEGTKFIGL